MMEVVLREASRQGFTADAMVCADDVPQGRPAPWMALENARRLRIFPMEALVKVDDTVPGIEEGLNAGMWSIGVVQTGNELGLSRADTEALPSDELARRLEEGRARLARAGAHVVIDTIAEQEKLTATESDLDDKITEMAEKRGVNPGQLYAQLQKAQRLSELERGITEDKVFAWLFARNTIEE